MKTLTLQQWRNEARGVTFERGMNNCVSNYVEACLGENFLGTLDVLGEVLFHPDHQTKRHTDGLVTTVNILGHFGSYPKNRLWVRKLADFLLDVASRHTDPEVRDEAFNALELIGVENLPDYVPSAIGIFLPWERYDWVKATAQNLVNSFYTNPETETKMSVATPEYKWVTVNPDGEALPPLFYNYYANKYQLPVLPDVPWPKFPDNPNKAPFQLFRDDIPDSVLEELLCADWVAVDTETTGLNPRDARLCVVQIYSNTGHNIAVQMTRHTYTNHPEHNNLETFFQSFTGYMVFHHARFDLGFLRLHLGVMPQAHIFCTRTASRIARTFSGAHSLVDVVFDMLGVKLDKTQQTSYWGAEGLNPEQLAYASGDVQHLIPLALALWTLALLEHKDVLVYNANKVIPTLVSLDLAGYQDVFGYSK